MKIIRLLWLVTLVISATILTACVSPDPKPFTITLTSNIENVTPTYETGPIIEGRQSYILTAPEVEDYDFAYWHLENSTIQISTDRVYTYTPIEDITLEAFYTPIEVVEDYTVLVTANIDDVTLTISDFLTNSGATQYELIAPEVEGYTFLYWVDTVDSSTLSTNHTYTFVVSKDIHIEAVYEEIEVTLYTITLTSDLEAATLSLNQIENEVTITATEVIGYTFLYWMDSVTEEIVSLNIEHTFTATKDQAITAVYEAIIIVEPTLFYETHFEDAAKTSYAIATITLSDQPWVFADALIGDLAGDLDVSGSSVRIRDGYIQTAFLISDLAQVIFHAGTYGSDVATTVRFELSTDDISWTTVDSFTSTATMEEYSYIFTEELFTSLSLDSSASYYLRIVSETTARTNIDHLQIYTGEGSIIDDSPLYTITLTDDMIYQYLLNEVVDLTDCIATHKTTGDTTCDVLGTVDTTVAGLYEITFYKIDEFNRTASITVTISVITDDNEYLLMDLIPYYDNAEGLYGEDLINALNLIINNGFIGVTYGEARYILDDSDQDPNNASNLILIYRRTSVPGVWDNGITWNREHIWPQSLLGESANNTTVNMASDLYNLMPSNPAENTSRGNNPYTTYRLGYEPPDEVKGDIARALFYMMIMYPELNLVNYYPGLHEMGYLDELLAWHYLDPVDSFELHRMDIIFAEQHNRNPFVDYPHFVSLIWFHEELPPS